MDIKEAALEMLKKFAADDGKPGVHCVTLGDGTTYLRTPSGEVMTFDSREAAQIQVAIIQAEARARRDGVLP